MTPSPAPVRFTATLRKLAMNYCVDVPAEASRALGGDPPERYVRVEGAANGHPFATRLTPRGGGAYRLFLDGAVRAAAGIAVGDEVPIEVARAEAPPEPPLPDDLLEALSTLDGGAEAFAALTEAQRTGMIAFVERARTASTRAGYVERVVEEVRRRLGADSGAFCPGTPVLCWMRRRMLSSPYGLGSLFVTAISSNRARRLS